MSTTTSGPRTSCRTGAARLGAALLVAAASLADGVRAGVLHVPGAFPTVAEAVAAAQPGDEIVLAAGSYGEPIVLDGLVDVVLRGQGAVVLTGGDELTAALTVTDCSGVTIENLRIAQPPGNGVFVGQSDAVTLSRLRVEDAGSYGILAGESSDLLVERCRIEGAGQDGIALVLALACTISRCTVADTAQFGISLSDVGDSTVERCRVRGALNAGIALGAGDPVVACRAVRNVVQDVLAAPGIRSLGTDNVVTGNVVKRIDSGGIQLFEPSSGGVVEGNRILDCDFGIFSRGTGPLIRDNRVIRPLDAGIACRQSGFVLLDNRVQHPLTDGYDFSADVTGGQVIGCRVSHAVEYGFDVDSSGVTFADNVSAGAGVSGFLVTGDGNAFLGNTSSGGVGLQDEGLDNVFLGNDFGIP